MIAGLSDKHGFENDIQQCITVLKSGGLILYPTDTVWGIGCDATNENAVQKIYDLKKRPDQKALIVLVADKKEVLQHVAAPDLQLFQFLEANIRPVTVIYEHAIGLASNLIAEDGSIAIRICRESFCRNLIKRFRKPIVSTSANVSGEATPGIFSQITATIKTGVDYQVKFRQEDQSPAAPSSIIRWQNGNIEVIRK